MRRVASLLRRLFRACFGRTQRVTPREFVRSAPRVRVAGPAVAAFDSEMYAAEQGLEWGPYEEGKWSWLVPIGHQEPPAQLVEHGAQATPIPPAPSKVPRLRLSGQGRNEPKTVRWVNRNVVKKGKR